MTLNQNLAKISERKSSNTPEARFHAEGCQVPGSVSVGAFTSSIQRRFLSSFLI